MQQHLLPVDKDNSINSVFTKADNNLVTGKEAANEINKYFCRISLELDAKLPALTDNTIYPKYSSVFSIDEINEITLEEIVKEIKQIDITKSSGFKNISTKIFKVIFSLTPLCLLHILNRCIMTAIFPSIGRQVSLLQYQKKH